MADKVVPGLPTDDYTEAGNARLFVALHGLDLKYCHPEKAWYVWTGKRWEADRSGAVLLKAKDVASILYDLRNTPPELLKEALAHARLSSKRKAIEAIPALAASDLPVLPEAFDADPYSFHTEGRVYTLRPRTLDGDTGWYVESPHRDHMATKLSPVEWLNPKDPPPCERYLRFLDEITNGDLELQGYLQRVAGYCLSGDVGEQALFFFHGSGANGKSTLLNLWLYLLGDYGLQAPPDLLLENRPDGHPTAIADLKGKRLVVCMEAGNGKRMAETLVKWLTGGDRITARRMYQDHFTFDPTHKIILSANHRPLCDGEDPAIWRRIHLVPFNVTIPVEKRDPDLPQALKLEAPGILAWMLAGWSEWRRIGLAAPFTVMSATENYRTEMDTIGVYLAEECEIGVEPWRKTKSSILYAAYTGWCQTRGAASVTLPAFSASLDNRGIHSHRTKNGYFKLGVSVKGGEAPF